MSPVGFSGVGNAGPPGEVKYPRAAFNTFLIINAVENIPVLGDSGISSSFSSNSRM